jgi:hypothetical protein
MNEIRSSLVCIDIRDVRGARDALLAEHFSAGERQALADATAPTIAGRLALKRAVGAVLPDSTRMPEIGTSTSGAPELRAGEPIFLSVSHTADFAYGLAVRQDASNE